MTPDDIKLTLALSKVHGVGVHAIRDIKKGEKLWCYKRPDTEFWGLDNLTSEVRDEIVKTQPIATKGYPYRLNYIEPISFMNHSDSPNYDKHTDKALVDIPANEEVTEDYGEYRDIINL